MIAWLKRARTWLVQLCCLHQWRPGLTSRGPAKACDCCGLVVQLNDAEYYAQFGTIPRAGLFR